MVDSSDLILARQTVVTVVCGANMITAIVWRRTVHNAGQPDRARSTDNPLQQGPQPLPIRLIDRGKKGLAVVGIELTQRFGRRRRWRGRDQLGLLVAAEVGEKRRHILGAWLFQMGGRNRKL